RTRAGGSGSRVVRAPGPGGLYAPAENPCQCFARLPAGSSARRVAGSRARSRPTRRPPPARDAHGRRIRQACRRVRRHSGHGGLTPGSDPSAGFTLATRVELCYYSAAKLYVALVLSERAVAGDAELFPARRRCRPTRRLLFGRSQPPDLSRRARFP